MSRCRDCKFYEPRRVSEGADGMCRRNAPNPVVDERNGKEVLLQLTVWPTVEGRDWCGEFKPKDVTVSTTPETKP